MRLCVLRSPFFILITIIFCLFVARPAESQLGTAYDEVIAPGNNYEKAEFLLWYPDKLEPIKAIVLLVPGGNMDGRPAVYDLTWQAFATRNGLALLGCWFTDKPHDQMMIEEYVNVSIYLPPSYEEGNRNYAVIYFLPGFAMPLWQSRFQSKMEKKVGTIEVMMLSGEIEEAIYVLIDGSNKFFGSWYLNSPTIGDWETYVVRDVVGFIDANYRTYPMRDSRGIEGYSMGGDGAPNIAFRHPDVFGVMVCHAGDHDWDTEKWRKRGLSTAGAAPQTWSEFQVLHWAQKATLALTAGCSPNPDKPPFYLDWPAKTVDGEERLIPEVWERIIAQDNASNLKVYLSQPVRLNGIKVIHGSADDYDPVEHGRAFHALLTASGVDHVYLEHGGGHDWLPEKSLPFFSQWLLHQVPSGIEANTRGEVKRADH